MDRVSRRPGQTECGPWFTSLAHLRRTPRLVQPQLCRPHTAAITKLKRNASPMTPPCGLGPRFLMNIRRYCGLQEFSFLAPAVALRPGLLDPGSSPLGSRIGNLWSPGSGARRHPFGPGTPSHWRPRPDEPRSVQAHGGVSSSLKNVPPFAGRDRRPGDPPDQSAAPCYPRRRGRRATAYRRTRGRRRFDF